jgi:hypothetical protein
MSISVTDSAQTTSTMRQQSFAAKKKKKVENFASVSSSIMMRLPTKNLGALRSIFTAKAEGLTIVEFLEAVINNMELPDVSVLMLMISDLTDFFQMVDINGDGHMEWEEFVMFILDAVVPNKDATLQERFSHAGTNLLQPSSTRFAVQVIKMIPALNKIVLAIGKNIQIYYPDEEQVSLTTLAHSFNIVNNDDLIQKDFSIIDVDFVQSHDILCVLKDDLSASFYKFRSPTNITVDTVVSLGTHNFNQAYTKVVFRDLPNLEIRMLGIYASTSIDSWKVNFQKWTKPEFMLPKTLNRHTDFIRDIIIINSQHFKFVASAGLDKTVQFWDLETLRHKFTRSGHKSGIQCLAYDGIRLVFGGGFDFTVFNNNIFSNLKSLFLFSDIGLGFICHIR